MKRTFPHPTQALAHHGRTLSRRGMILYSVVGILALLTAFAFVVFTATRIDFRIAQNHITALRALYQADNGLQYAKSQIEQDLVDGLSLEDIAAAFYLAPPDGFTFDPITALTQLSDTNLYLLSVTGRFRDAEATIEATIKRAEAMALGVFGNIEVGTFPSVDTYSYDSEHFVGVPVGLDDSSGEAAIGSNDDLIIQPNVTIDGQFLIGEDSGGVTGSYPAGWPVEEVGRIEPDPLGVESGALADEFSAVKINNDNANSPYIINNELILKNHGTIILPSGNYYLTEVDIGNHSELLADTSAGPVNLFLEGGFYMGPGGDLNTTGLPSDFRIFSNSSEQIQIKPKGEAKVFVYAPNAEVQMYPGLGFYGAVWSKDVDLKPGGNIWIDTSLLKKVKSNQITIVSWKEIRS